MRIVSIASNPIGQQNQTYKKQQQNAPSFKSLITASMDSLDNLYYLHTAMMELASGLTKHAEKGGKVKLVITQEGHYCITVPKSPTNTALCRKLNKYLNVVSWASDLGAKFEFYQ